MTIYDQLKSQIIYLIFLTKVRILIGNINIYFEISSKRGTFAVLKAKGHKNEK